MTLSARRDAPTKMNAPMQIRATFVGVDAHIDPYDA